MVWGPAQIAADAARGAARLVPVRRRRGREVPAARHRRSASRLRRARCYVLNRTKLGLLIRAGVQDREMVEAWAIASAASSSACSSPARRSPAWAARSGASTSRASAPQIGSQVNVLVFIVIIIGGLGSTAGCFVGALLVGLMANYIGFLAPKVAMFSNIGLMVAVLLWRPQGLYPVVESMSARAAPSALRRPAAQPLARLPAGRDPHRAGAGAVRLSRRARRSTSPPRSSSSSSWRRASTCCSATPASSASRTRCSSASAPMASPSRPRASARAGRRSALGVARALALSLAALARRSACSACACARSSSP